MKWNSFCFDYVFFRFGKIILNLTPYLQSIYLNRDVRINWYFHSRYITDVKISVINMDKPSTCSSCLKFCLIFLSYKLWSIDKFLVMLVIYFKSYYYNSPPIICQNLCNLDNMCLFKLRSSFPFFAFASWCMWMLLRVHLRLSTCNYTDSFSVKNRLITDARVWKFAEKHPVSVTMF